MRAPPPAPLDSRKRLLLTLTTLTYTPKLSPLPRASAKLTPDWRPPRQPDGLVLLRRIKTQVAPIGNAEPAITPSQLKKLARETDWIEVEVVDQDGEPYTGPYHLELPDATSSDGNFNEEGFFGSHDLDPGNCKLTLTDGAEVASAADVAPETEATASVAETASSTPTNPVSGAPVTGAGSSLTTDGDGTIES